jgi:hypothetical protein
LSSSSYHHHHHYHHHIHRDIHYHYEHHHYHHDIHHHYEYHHYHHNIHRRVWGRTEFEPVNGWPVGRPGPGSGGTGPLVYDISQFINQPPLTDKSGLRILKIPIISSNITEDFMLCMKRKCCVGIPVYMTPTYNKKKIKELTTAQIMSPVGIKYRKKLLLLNEKNEKMKNLKKLNSLNNIYSSPTGNKIYNNTDSNIDDISDNHTNYTNYTDSGQRHELRKIGWSPKNIYSYDDNNEDDKSIDSYSVGSIRKGILHVYMYIYVCMYS